MIEVNNIIISCIYYFRRIKILAEIFYVSMVSHSWFSTTACNEVNILLNSLRLPMAS